MPSINLLATAFGPVTGGTPVTINGTGFLANAAVTFDGVPATNVVVHSDIKITCNSPAGAEGPADVVVTNQDGQSGMGAGAFEYVGPPTVVSVSPPEGPTGGGTFVTIAGTDFQAGAGVTFDGAAATNVNVLDEQTIQCLTPAGAEGPADVVVTNIDGQSNPPVAAFDYVPAPTVTGVNPPSGPESGGTAVTIAGTGFRAGATVTFDGAAATNINITSPISLNCNTPAGVAGPADVVVTNADGQSSAPATVFDYVAAPTVIAVSPPAGPEAGGTPVTVTGTGFLANAVVTFDGVPATNHNITSNTSLDCNTPAGVAGPADVVVTNQDGQSSPPVSAYEYIPAPVPTSTNPPSGPEAGGTAVTIHGTGFRPGAAVTFDGVAATSVNVISDIRIDCVTPAGAAGPADIVVTNLDGQANAPATIFDYVAAPGVTSVNPPSGPASGGTPVTIAGTDFLTGATVTFNGNPATNVVVASNISITCNTPAGTAGPADVVVTNQDGQSSPPATVFDYVAAPTVTSVTAP